MSLLHSWSRVVHVMHDSTTLPALQSVCSPSSLHTSTSRWNTAYQTGWHICITCLSFHTFLTFQKKKHFFNHPFNGEWIVHIGGCLTWCVTSLISDMIFLYQQAQAHPHNALHFLVIGWCHTNYGDNYSTSAATLANCRLSQDIGWLVMHSLYLSRLRELADWSRHAIAI